MKAILYAAAALSVASSAIAAPFTVTGQASAPSFTYMKIEWTSKAGVTETGVLRLACSGATMTGAAIHSPRDAATGMASGKRTHKPLAIIKEWGAASPSLAKGGNWDLATNKGGKTMATDDWHSVSVTGLDAACAAPPAGKVNYQDISITK